jgi:hypothetical protein
VLTVGTHGAGAAAKTGVSVASKSAKARNVIRATNRGDDTAMVAQSQHMVEEAGAAPSWVRTPETILTRATMPSWFYSPSPPNFDHGHGDEGHEGEEQHHDD